MILKHLAHTSDSSSYIITFLFSLKNLLDIYDFSSFKLRLTLFFLRHMGRCIYGGIYDPESPHADSNGYRLDVLTHLRTLRIPVMRYPGGNFVATYHWQDGIGPRSSRPKRPELAWLGVESNQFGTDEFMHWLEELSKGEDGKEGTKCEPYIALNFGTGTLDEALAWVEYCNGTKDTHFANLRRKNGREEPYNVKYWALGNEVSYACCKILSKPLSMVGNDSNEA